MYVMGVKSIYCARLQTSQCVNFAHPFYRQIYMHRLVLGGIYITCRFKLVFIPVK